MEDFTNHYRNKTVAITGASGYLASVLIDALQKTSARILRISRQDLSPIAGTETIKADVREGDCWEEIVSRADIIFHLAGNTSVYTAARNPADSLKSTVFPITHLVGAAQTIGRKRRVVFASTATVYGLTDDLPVTEDMEPKPITNYDLHKLFAEQQLELASRKGIIEGVSLRLANVYGPSLSANSSDDRGIINRITKMALEGANLRLYGDGNYLRDYVYIDDVARGFMVAGVEKEIIGRSFNVASGKGIAVREAFLVVAALAEKMTGKSVRIENAPWPKDADPIEFRNFVADISGLQKVARWRPNINFHEGISRMISVFCR